MRHNKIQPLKDTTNKHLIDNTKDAAHLSKIALTALRTYKVNQVQPVKSYKLSIHELNELESKYKEKNKFSYYI